MIPGQPQNKHALPVKREFKLHQGPLPDPVTFGEYDKVLPGASERIMTMCEQEANHRHLMDKEQIIIQNRKIDDAQKHTGIEKEYADSETNIAMLGVVFAFVISLVIIAGGMYMIIATDHFVMGTLFSGVGIAPLIGSFIQGTRTHHSDKV